MFKSMLIKKLTCVLVLSATWLLLYVLMVYEEPNYAGEMFYMFDYYFQLYYEAKVNNYTKIDVWFCEKGWSTRKGLVSLLKNL